MRLMVFCVSVLLFFSTLAQARIVESFTIRGWRGDAFVNDQTGKFDSCVAIAKYKSGISMSVQVDGNYNWWIGFSAPGWKMTKGEDIPLQFRIDRGKWQQGVAKAVSPELARMPMPADGYIITRFRRGRTLFVYDGSYNYQFRLTGTSRLMQRLAKCVEKNSAFHGTSPSSNTTSEPANSGLGTNTDASTPSSNAELQVEATQVLFNLMGRLSLQDLELKDADAREENLKAIHAFAKNDARSIAVHIRTQDTYDETRDIMASMMSSAIKTCAGDFSAGITNQLVDGAETLTGNSTCAAGDYELVEHYSIAPRSKGGVFVYAISDTYVGEGGGAPVSPKVDVSSEAFNEATLAVSK